MATESGSRCRCENRGCQWGYALVGISGSEDRSRDVVRQNPNVSSWFVSGAVPLVGDSNAVGATRQGRDGVRGGLLDHFRGWITRLSHRRRRPRCRRASKRIRCRRVPSDPRSAVRAQSPEVWRGCDGRIGSVVGADCATTPQRRSRAGLIETSTPARSPVRSKERCRHNARESWLVPRNRSD